jgi:hypothetical protein
MNGYIKLNRDIKETWIYKNPIYLKAWIDILMNVNYKECAVRIRGKVLKCKKGEALFSLDTWAAIFGKKEWTKEKVRRFFKRLESEQYISTKGDTGTTRLCILESTSYEETEHDSSTIVDTKETRNQTTSKEEEEEIRIKYSYIRLFENLQNGTEIRRTQLDKNFNFALFPAEFSDNLKNECLKFFKYLESKKGDNWGVLGTLSSQISVLKSHFNKFSESEIIESLQETQTKGNISYNPEWTKNRKSNYNKPKTKPNTNSDGTPSYMMGLKY